MFSQLQLQTTGNCLITGVVPYRSRIACQEVAKAKILARLDSTCLASVPTSATLILNNGFRAASAIVSAVDVLPTPGGPYEFEKDVWSAGEQVREEVMVYRKVG